MLVVLVGEALRFTSWQSSWGKLVRGREWQELSILQVSHTVCVGVVRWGPFEGKRCVTELTTGTQGSSCPLVVKYRIFIGRQCRYKLCRELNIPLSVEWVSRNDNSTANELSRVENATDYMLDPKCICYIDQLWGPHTFDRFASIKTKQLDRYCSRHHNPRCEASNAFTISWSRDNNWIFPPPLLIPKVLRHMSTAHEYGTVIVTVSCGVVASPSWQVWNLKKLYKAVFVDWTLPENLPLRVRGQQYLHFWNSIICCFSL